jgi:hypothetical protein
MGKVGTGSVLGDMSGKVGSIVITQWKETTVVKSLPTKTKRGKKSLEQARQRTLFETVGSFLRPVGDGVISVGYQLSGKSKKITPANAAASYHMLNTVRGDYPDYKIDFSKVKLSRPIHFTEQGWNAKFSAEKGLKLSVDWELNSFPDKFTRLDDIAIIVIFDITADRVLTQRSYKGGLLRSELQYSFSGVHRDIGHEVCCWMFFISADGKRVSETEYLGTVKMMG